MRMIINIYYQETTFIVVGVLNIFKHKFTWIVYEYGPY